MAKVRTAKQKAALRKAQLASARKRKGRGKARPPARGSRRRKAGKIVAGAAAVGAVGYGVYHSRSKVRKAAYNRAKENPTARKAAVGHLRKNVVRKPGLKLAPEYRQGLKKGQARRKARLKKKKTGS
jgi:hypothetical protein